MPIPVHALGGSGRFACLSVANGFPPETYRPLAEALASRLHIVSPLPRPLWPDPPSPQDKGLWRRMAGDLLTALREHDLHDAIAIGHSMGGAFTVLAAAAEPARFRALILLDPTLLPPPQPLLARLTQISGLAADLPLVQSALHRRDRFASVDEALAHWRGKALFADWPNESLRLYARAMTRPAPDGGLALTWPPEWEAAVYRTYPARLWAAVARLPARLPVLVIRGGRSDTFTARSAQAFRRRASHAQMRVVDGHGHLFPHTAPGETAALIAQWLDRDAGDGEAAAAASRPGPPW